MFKKRSWFIAASILVMLMLGSVYSWSIIRVSVESEFNVSATESGLPYMFSLVSYSTSMLIAGKSIKKHQRAIVILGAVSFMLGLILSSLAVNIFTLTLSYGVLVGTGVGLIYGVPLFVINQTFPDRIGFFSGLVLLGFGFSSVIMAPLIEFLLLNGPLSSMFMVLFFISLGVFFLTVPFLIQPVLALEGRSRPATPISKGSFRLLYGLFLLSLISGLMIIGLTYRIGVLSYGYDGFFVAGLLTTFAVANALARPLFGWIIDKKNIFFAGTLSLVLIALSGLTAFFNQGQLPVLFALNYGFFWFGLGSWVAIAPLAVKKLFGAHNYAHLYGTLFTAYGVAAVLGTLFSGAVLDLFGSTLPIYGFIVIINIVNLVLLKQLEKTTSTQ
jgi:OFA family oxalate/formate antiporter-like MFS transporter